MNNAILPSAEKSSNISATTTPLNVLLTNTAIAPDFIEWAQDEDTDEAEALEALAEDYPAVLTAADRHQMAMSWSTFESRLDTPRTTPPQYTPGTDPTLHTGPWSKLRDLLLTSLGSYRKMAAPLFGPVTYPPQRNHRNNDNVEAVYGIALDFDEDPDPAKLLDCFHDCELTLSHSFCSHPLSPRLRLTIPLAAPIPADQYARFWDAMRYLAVAGGKADVQAKDVSRASYLPTTPASADAWLTGFFSKTGKPKESYAWAAANTATWTPQSNRWQSGEVITAAQWMEHATSKGWIWEDKRAKKSTATTGALSDGGNDLLSADRSGLTTEVIAQINAEPELVPTVRRDERSIAALKDMARFTTADAYRKLTGDDRPPTRDAWKNFFLLPLRHEAQLRPDDEQGLFEVYELACETFGGDTSENLSQWRATTANGVRDLGSFVLLAQAGGWKPAPLPVAVPAPGVVGVAAPTREVCDSELKLAERFAQDNADHLKWCPELGSWLGWQGVGWTLLPDGAPEVHQRLKLMIRTAIKEAIDALGTREGARRAAESLTKTLEGKRALDNILDLSKREQALSVRLARLDQHPLLLRCQNAVLDLSQGVAIQPEREQYITRAAAVDFDPAATCPRWEQFIDEVCQGDAEQMQIIQRVIGLALSGLQWKGFALLYGPTGDNGKSTLVEAIVRMLGSYAISLPSTAVAVQNSTSNADRMKLAGARLAVVPEWDKGTTIDTAFVKSITGGDTVTARAPFAKTPIEFVSQATLIVVGNHRPNITENSDAMWNRTWSIPFEYVPPVKDKGLPAKLDAERSGILNWAMKGLQDFQREGMTRTVKMTEAQAEYRHTSDVLGDWREANVIETPGSWTLRADLQNDYRNFMAARGLKPMRPQSFVGALEERGFTTATRQGTRGHRGLELKPKTDPFKLLG